MKRILDISLRILVFTTLALGTFTFFAHVHNGLEKARKLRIKVAIQQGYDEAAVGVPIIANPHSVVTTNHALWRHGWMKRKLEERQERQRQQGRQELQERQERRDENRTDED